MSVHVLVPVDADGEWFRPSLGTRNGFKIGDKKTKSEYSVESYWEALQHLSRMTTPKWRRKTNNANVKAREWLPKPLDQLEAELASNARIPKQPPCPMELQVVQQAASERLSLPASSEEPEATGPPIAPEFDRAILDDARTTRVASIKARQGQPEFRSQLLKAYSGRCAFSGCGVTEVLEAAHLVAHTGRKSNTVNNGLILRADIHSLFDQGLIDIDEDNWTVKVSTCLMHSEYGKLHGKAVLLPGSPADRPWVEAIRRRRDSFP
jgi:hypothetical protein